MSVLEIASRSVPVQALWEIGNQGFNDPAQFDRLPSPLKAELIAWIQTMLRPVKSPWRSHTSYGLKHVFENDPNREEGAAPRYVTNGAFKGAMLACGYTPEDPATQNWSFSVRPTDGKVWRYCFRYEHGASDREKTIQKTLKSLERIRARQIAIVEELIG